ncbi:MAG: carboxypeptidase-like regulatory domain-containing protein, partial [Flammeovirgaceae bacterium]
MKALLFVVLLFSITVGKAQITTTLEGRVLDEKTGEPIPFANVFLDNTTLGTVSEQNGNFIIRNVFYPAHYEIVVSFVGYKTYRAKVPIQPDKNKLGIIRLTPDETALSEIEVKAKRDATWERSFRKFKRFFLGNNSAAQMCKILNPWVV